ncbi:MAG: valine--tRNA ligase, partial [Saprospiraceae bacterium]|nr:valine--tRNA ligase [Saprospiraceae bacterium]
DILIRKARLDGKNACWVPGTDHASIATEAKVVKMLRERGIKKSDLSRDEFLDYAWEWKDKFGNIILDQLQRLGASCDWDRTRFTMEPEMTESVIRVFVDLYKKGKIYRGLRMTNWDPEAQTVLSNEEVIYKEEDSRLYFFRYRVEGSEDDWVTIATVRPETILGDTAVAVHPDDDRYKHLKGKRVIIPLVGRSVPVIFDDYVDREFGTGALKITPAHDVNDYEIGQRHGLEVVDVLNPDGSMSEEARFYVGKDRFVARALILKDLEKAGHLLKVENYPNKVGRSERTDAIVEPRLTLQWFVEMKGFAKTALQAVSGGDIDFVPEHFWNMYYSWLREENIRDWCISRQLWWGQRVPVWYLKKDTPGEEEVFFVAETAEEALKEARHRLNDPGLQADELRQDEDVLDTWFSSWLWPITVFDGFHRQDELRYYYPTQTLVTGWDIIFLWVARMIIAGYEWSEELLGQQFIKENGRMPFRTVYFTGMVRDHQRRKMSKTLGNSPDALILIDRYGADGVRFGMLSSASAGNDIIFDAPIDPETGRAKNESKLCEQGRNFCNKMWNALRLIQGWETDDTLPEDEPAGKLARKWMDQRLSKSLEEVEKAMADFRLSDALMNLYKLIWSDFCSWYLEMIKPGYEEPIDRKTRDHAIAIFEKMMVMLHPFMPFVTEEIWHHLRDRKEGEDCIVASYPEAESYEDDFIRQVERAKQVVTSVRDARNKQGIKMREELKLYAQKSPETEAMLNTEGITAAIEKMANLKSLQFTSESIDNSVSFLIEKDKFFLELTDSVDVGEECARLQKELDYYRGFLKSVQGKLKNEKFVQNAPEAVVEKERQKLSDGEAKIKNIREALERLGC